MLQYTCVVLILAVVACGGKQSDATGSSAGAAGAEMDQYPYCSPTEGPLTAQQAASVSNAILCPPPGTTNFLSATCLSNIYQGSSGEPTDASVPEWVCVIRVPNGATVGPGDM
jgi:hypothetical protein